MQAGECNGVVVSRPGIIARRVIAFGCSILDPEVYGRCAQPGIARAAEPRATVIANAASGSVARGFNLLLQEAAKLPDIEALVIVHEDAELLDDDFCTRLRRVLADPEVALVGAAGAVGVTGIAWWDGQPCWSSATYRHGVPGSAEIAFGEPPPPGPREVDSLYGVVMALSPWAIENLWFDESIGLLHGYDFDVCRQARLAGKKVVTAELNVDHHHSLDLVKVSEIEVWVSAHIRAAELWDESSPGQGAPDSEWKPRARAAEAQAAAARLLAASKLLHADASARHDDDELHSIRASRSWRLTEPLRQGNALVKRVRRRSRA